MEPMLVATEAKRVFRRELGNARRLSEAVKGQRLFLADEMPETESKEALLRAIEHLRRQQASQTDVIGILSRD